MVRGDGVYPTGLIRSFVLKFPVVDHNSWHARYLNSGEKKRYWLTVIMLDYTMVIGFIWYAMSNGRSVLDFTGI